jgi:hypothetical protein
MPKITFRGQTYNSEFEMPEDVRQEYQQTERRKKVRNESLQDVVDMTPEVRAVYERAMNRIEDPSAVSSRPLSDLPNTEDIYRQSAPADMKHLPSDESVYRQASPVIDPVKSTIEPEPGIVPSRLVSSVVWALILFAIAYLIMQFL